MRPHWLETLEQSFNHSHLADQLAAASTVLEQGRLADQVVAATATFEQNRLADQLAAASTLLEQSDLPRLTAETTAFEQSLADQLAAASTLLERSNLADLTAETATFEQGLADQLAAASTLLEQSDLPRLTAETTAFEQSLADQLAAASALLEQSDFAGLTAETTAFEQSLADQLAAASALLERNEFARLMAETTALDRRELFDRLGDIEESLAAEQERNRDDFVGYVDDESFEVRDSLPGAQNPPRDGKSLAARRIETMWRVLGVFVTIDTIFLGGAATPALREAAIKGLAIIAHKVLLSLLLAGAQSPSLSSTPSVLGPETLSNPTHVSAEAFSEGHAVDEALMPVRDKDR